MPAPVAHSSHHWYKDKLGDVLVLAGIGAGVGAIVEYSAARSDLDSAEKASSVSSYDSMVDSAHTERNVSIVFAGASVLLIGSGIVHYMIANHGDEHAVAAVPTRGGAIVTFSGGF